MLRIIQSHKLIATFFLVSSALTLGGVGSYASFTGSTSAQAQTVASGTMSLTIPAAGASNRLTVNASAIAPGDTIQRAFDLTVGGSIAAASIVLTTTATTSSLLDTDTSDGLKMTLEKCTAAWTESGSEPYTYTCGGGATQSTVLASRAVIGSNIALADLGLAAGDLNRLRLTLTLPATAGNTLQNQTSTISYQFASTQRAAASK